MINVTNAAAKRLKDFAETRENPDEVKLRIYIGRAGWAGPQCGVALDERKFGSDIVVESNGAKVVYTSDLQDQVKNVRIDYTNKWYFKGFTLS